ncbi:MAG: peptidylprolyl isomerase [Betaproteobacteria bacterium]|nr:peptidylprolyl isomerase [Betaproteobacteria bacterium]
MSLHASMKTLATIAAAAALAGALAQPAAGQAPDTTLASMGDIKVTLADYEASILRIPENDRFGWAMSQERVSKEVDNLLRIRALAAEAKRMGMDNDPTYKTRVALYAERLLTEAVAAKIDVESAKEFDTRRAVYLERAREQYLINKQQYQAPAEVKASHILVDLKGRTPEEALAKAKALRARITAGESFEAVAEANSDDPSAKQNKGSLGFFGPGMMDPAFEAAAYALKQIGEIGEPVKSQFGYHLIRLDDRKPPRQLTFEEVSAELMEKLKSQFLETRRAQVVRSTYDPARVKWNEPAVIGLRKTVDPALFKVPVK